jgi:cell division protein FtsL
MPRKKELNRRAAKAVKRSRALPLALWVMVILAGFGALMVRLEITQEGYRLSALRGERRQLEERNRELRLEVAQLSSHERLRAIAARDGLGPPARGHVVMVP